MLPSDTSIEGYYHSALEACAQASQLESERRSTDALTEYRRSIALIEAMRQLAHSGRDIDEAYFAGVEDVEGICRVHIAKLEGELPTLRVPLQRDMRRKSTESLNFMARTTLTRAESVPPRQEHLGMDRNRRAVGARPERPRPSRSPSPEKKEKKSMPLSLRSGFQLTRQTSSDSTMTTTAPNASVAAREASRAATLAWQGKKPNGMNNEPRRRAPSPTQSRNGSLDLQRKRPSVPDTASLLDAPLIDFSAPVLDTSPSSAQDTMSLYNSYTPISPTPTPPPHSSPPPPRQSQSDSLAAPRRKPAPAPPARHLGRSNATISRPQKPLNPPSLSHPRSASAPDLSEQDQRHELPPISVSISEDISPEQELSREEKALKNLKGVDESLAKTILNDIVVRGDEVQWDDIAGLEEAKTSLKETVIYPFLRPDLFSGLREPARGMLLFGPPGTGKTMLARAVATQAKSTFFSVSASTLVSKYLGESEKLVKALFALAKALSPSIIFVDEIDSLLSSRSGGDNENEASRRLKTEFLIQWSSLASAAAARTNAESPRVLVLAATNLPWAIDDAARRRFVLRQYIPLPERETRRVQFASLLSKQHHTLTEDQFEQLVTLTEGFSGSDITALTKDAAMGPLRSLGEALLTTKREEIRAIGFEDFVTSLRKVRPSVSKEGLHAFEKWNDEFGSKG